jgi:single-stranded-DNA-specific exonuclease
MLIKKRVLPTALPSFSSPLPVLQRIFAARGIEREEQLDKKLPALLPFNTLTDIEKAAITHRSDWGF